MIRVPPRATRTDTLLPYTTLFRSPRPMVKAIRIHEPGGPEVLRYEDVAVPTPGPAEVLLQQKACGLNYIDVYHRMGTYPLQYTAVIGREGMGVVEAGRSEERRVGKECVRTGRYGWAPEHIK